MLVTPYQAIKERVRKADPTINVNYNKGADINSTDRSNFTAATNLVKSADVAILVMGIGTCVGPWNGMPSSCIEAEAWDRLEMGLTGVQPELMRELIATGTPLVLVLMSGSPLILNEWTQSSRIPSVLQHWYSGEEGGNALAELLFGDVSPSGRLPIIFPFSEAQVPKNAQDYDMRAGSGRTYRYSTVVPLYSFGYGLSYTAFQYNRLSSPLISPLTFNASSAPPSLQVKVEVRNVGLQYAADEITQVYFSFQPFDPVTKVQSIPRTELKTFVRQSYSVSSAQQINLHIPTSSLHLVGADGKMGLQRGVYIVQVGGSAPGSRGQAVDGEDQNGGMVEVERPDIEELSATCSKEAADWWSENEVRGEVDGVYGEMGAKEEEQRMTRVNVPFGIADGLSAVLTVC